MRALPLLWLAVLAAGCQNVHATVECDPDATGVTCTVHQDQGTADIEVCWDLSVACADNVRVTAPRSCAHVHDGNTNTVAIPNASLANLDKCKGGTMELGTMTINGDKPDTTEDLKSTKAAPPAPPTPAPAPKQP